MGGSYGGYLTMMAVTKYPDMWAAGVAIVPLRQLVYRTRDRRSGHSRVRHLDHGRSGRRTRRSTKTARPSTSSTGSRRRLLLIAGGNDVRDPRGEAEQVAAAIKKNGGFVQLKIYENEGHQFSRIENQIDAYQRVSDFLKVRVPSPGCGCSIYE